MDINTKSTNDTLLEAFILHRAKLVQIARRVLRCPCLAEDVVQDAALKATVMAGPRCIDCPLHFACQIVRNLAIDRERRRALERSHAAPEALAEVIEAPCADPAAQLEMVETLHCLAAAIGELPDRTRRVFERHRLSQVPQKVIAAELGVSPTLVNFMIRDADAHCRASLHAAAAPAPCRLPCRRTAAAAPAPRGAGAPPRAGSRALPQPAAPR